MPMAWKEEMKSGEMPKQRKGNPNLGMILTEYVQKEASFFFFFFLVGTSDPAVCVCAYW